MTPPRYGLGWIPNLEDKRDADPKYQRRFAVESVSQYELDMPELVHDQRNQRSERSCVGRGSGAMIEVRDQLDGNPYVHVSDHAFYWGARAVNGFQKEDEGAYPRSGWKNFRRHGVCSEKAWPSLTDTINKMPSVESQADGIVRADWIYSIVQERGEGRAPVVLERLQSKCPGGMGIGVTDAFDRAGTDTVPAPKSGDTIRGLHWIAVLGFDRAGQRLRILNSWGKNWGDGGWAWLDIGWLWAAFTDDITFLLPPALSQEAA